MGHPLGESIGNMRCFIFCRFLRMFNKYIQRLNLNIQDHQIPNYPVIFPLREIPDSKSEIYSSAGFAEGDLGVSKNGGYLQFLTI